MKDKLNPHYYTKGIDCIDYITSKDMSFLEGNVVKYITRHRMKNGLEDLMKAQWYLTRLIEDYSTVEQRVEDEDEDDTVEYDARGREL